MIMLRLPENFDMSVRKEIEDLAKNVRSIPTFDQVTPLAEGFQPGPMDVICARGKRAFNHSGNRRFRALITERLESYSKAGSKLEKSVIVSEIVDSVREASPDGGFVKEERGHWFEVGDHNAREKIGQRYVSWSLLAYRTTLLILGFLTTNHALFLRIVFAISCITSTRAAQKPRRTVASSSKKKCRTNSNS